MTSLCPYQRFTITMAPASLSRPRPASGKESGRGRYTPTHPLFQLTGLLLLSFEICLLLRTFLPLCIPPSFLPHLSLLRFCPSCIPPPPTVSFYLSTLRTVAPINAHILYFTGLQREAREKDIGRGRKIDRLR